MSIIDSWEKAEVHIVDLDKKIETLTAENEKLTRLANERGRYIFLSTEFGREKCTFRASKEEYAAIVRRCNFTLEAALADLPQPPKEQS